MKTWMKVLMWLGLGGGIGFFAGYQMGARKAGEAYNDGYSAGVEDREKTAEWDREEAANAMSNYRGDGDFDGDSVQGAPVEDAEMPEEAPVIGDEKDIEEIPYPHPQYFVPEQISEDEYYTNPWGYDQEQLYFYELDEVLYNKETRKAIKDKDTMDQVIGIGMTFNFYKSDGEVLDAIFVRNDTTGVVYRIDRIDAAYTDEIDGGDSPEYELEDDTE